MSSEDKKKLLEQLDALKIFPKNKLVRELQRQIKNKLERLEKRKEIKLVSSTINAIAKANLSRATKLRKYHHYVRLIRNNFPDLDYSTIRKQFSERKLGTQVSIPDVIWQNPSP